MLLTPSNILKKINAEIKNYSYGDEPKNLYDPITYIMDLGGKRLRPMLTSYAYSLYKNDITEVIKPSIAIEIFHNFTLMHDDIMDNAPLRRGKPTVHEKWDNNIGILSGDVMLVKAYEALEGLESRHFKKVFSAFNKCATGVCEGQQLDMDFSNRESVTLPEYLEMIKLKTAILLGFSVEMGAILADASDSDIVHLKAFGESIGIAFQITDDLLDVYGDADKFGKKVGGDILECKKTFLSIKANEVASKTDKAKLKELFQKDKINDDVKVFEVIKLYDKLNIRQITEAEIQAYFERSLQHLTHVKADIFRKGLMKKFLSQLMERQN